MWGRRKAARKELRRIVGSEVVVEVRRMMDLLGLKVYK